MADRPNIILITTDQQRADTIGAAGCDWMTTPNLDKIAAGGVLFTRAFSCAATCVSSRAALYTGLYPHNTGVFSFDPYTGRLNWTHRLRAAGYRTVSIGKTHIDGANHGYDERIAEQGNKCYPFEYDRENGKKQPSLWATELRAAGYEVPLDLHELDPRFFEKLAAVEWTLPEKFHPDIWLGEKAVGWIAGSACRQPLFLHIGFMGPHDLYDPTPRARAIYDDCVVPVPDFNETDRANVPDELFAAERRCHAISDLVTSIHAKHATPENIRRMRRHYYANVTMIDEQIGRIIDALERKGLLENSVVVFTSDHGDNLFDHGLFYKGEMYDTVVNVPLIVRSSRGVAPGRKVRDLVSHLDAVRYILECAGVAADDLDGQTLGPVVEEGKRHSREFVYAEEGPSGLRPEPELLAMIRSENAKLVYFSGMRTGQLFDLAADPAERVNLWDDPGAAGLKTALLARLLDWHYRNAFSHRNIFSRAR